MDELKQIRLNISSWIYDLSICRVYKDILAYARVKRWKRAHGLNIIYICVMIYIDTNVLSYNKKLQDIPIA